MFVFSLQLQSVLVDILGVLLGDFLSMISRVFNLEMGNENKFGSQELDRSSPL